MPSTADTICQAGVSYPVAIEIARQMALGTPNGSASALVNSGLAPMKATELARQINAGVFSAHLLCLAMWNSETAKVIKKVSGL